jgi:hypothetical protein
MGIEMQNKTIAGIAAVFMLGAGAAQADEMPIRGICFRGPEVVTFTGTRNPDELYESTGETGVTQIIMSQADFQAFMMPQMPPVKSALADQGFSSSSVGELAISFRHNSGGSVTVKTSNDNFRNILGTYLNDWKCTVAPNPGR